ncbi:hypothetical protein [Bernardetia sp. MNP-M8]|uniref:hypothetical protein n=1 Tax=Bernardetia sp. MNP-M8 TaxID=3127470 RepID=UPI0030D622C8
MTSILKFSEQLAKIKSFSLETEEDSSSEVKRLFYTKEGLKGTLEIDFREEIPLIPYLVDKLIGKVPETKNTKRPINSKKNSKKNSQLNTQKNESDPTSNQ